jgi:hypothetical protein
MMKAAFSKTKKNLLQQIALKSKDKISGFLVLEHRFVWCWKVHTLKIRSEISGKFWNLVLEKKGENR